LKKVVRSGFDSCLRTTDLPWYLEMCSAHFQYTTLNPD